MQKGQSSVELLIILAVSVTILTALVSFTSEHVANIEKQQSIDGARDTVNRLAREINQVYLSGPGSVRDVILPFPRGIDASQSRLSENNIILHVYGNDISAQTISPLQGVVPSSNGLQRIRLIAYADYVVISLVSVISDTDTLYVALARDTNTSKRISFTNFNHADANVSFTLTWTPTLASVSLSDTQQVISPGDSFSLDILIGASGTAQGNYVGYLTATSSIGSDTEETTIPINVEVFAASQDLLTAIPSSLLFFTIGSDTDVQSIQLCNAGSTPIKSISFTPTTTPPGSWISPISTIDQLDPSSCQDVNVSITVPSGVSSGGYAGSVTISDYTGANYTNVSFLATVQTMNSYFTWDWNAAQPLTNELIDFSFQNTHDSQIITIDRFTMKAWHACDSELSLLTDISFNKTSVYAGGSASDDEEVNITNYAIQPNTTVSESNVITFSGDISDENEQFIPVVEFTDGSVYTGTPFGNGCVVDSIPPGGPASFSSSTGHLAESVLLSFTFPGDDNQTGTVSSVDIRYSTSDINSQASFNAATQTAYTGSILSAGNTATQLVEDLNVGYTYYFSIQFLDEASNGSTLPLSATSRPRNTFRYSLGDFNISSFAFSRPSPTAGQMDVNEFRLRSMSGSGDRNVYLRVGDDSNAQNAWIMAVGVPSTSSRINDVRIWYPATNTPGIPGTAPQYQGNPNVVYSSNIDLLSAAVLPTEYRFNGTNVNIPNSTTLTIDWLSNLSDLNITFDQRVV